MPEGLRHGLELVARLLEILGAGALILGFVISTGYSIRKAFRDGARPAMARYRQALGRTILVGLEILIAATIIKTVTLAPTPKGVAILATLVAIRTVLGWTTVLEMYGRWPWQNPRQGGAEAAAE